MKHIRLIAGTTLGLFFIGIFSGPFLLKLTEKFIGKEVVGLTVLSSLTPPLSLGLLLAFCSICAGCLLWAYSKNDFVHAPKLVFGLGLLLSFFTAVIGVVSKLFQFRFALRAMGDELDNTSVAMEAINYFSWGFGLTLFVNAIAIAILLLLSLQRQKDNNNTVSVSNN